MACLFFFFRQKTAEFRQTDVILNTERLFLWWNLVPEKNSKTFTFWVKPSGSPKVNQFFRLFSFVFCKKKIKSYLSIIVQNKGLFKKQNPSSNGQHCTFDFLIDLIERGNIHHWNEKRSYSKIWVRHAQFFWLLAWFQYFWLGKKSTNIEEKNFCSKKKLHA